MTDLTVAILVAQPALPRSRESGPLASVNSGQLRRNRRRAYKTWSLGDKMRVHPMLTLVQASEIVECALQHGRQKKYQPLTVAVLNANAALIVLKSEDGSSLLRSQIAQAKAWGALGMGMGTRALAERAASHPAFISALNALTDGKIVPVPGGVLVRSDNDDIIGAVGISGDHADHDESCAVAAIEAVGLTPDTGARGTTGKAAK